MDHVRKKIAEHMVLSKRTAAHVTTVAEVDVSRIVEAREKAKADFERREGFKLTYTAFFVEAAVRALAEFPLLNSSLNEDRIVVKKAINIGIAVGMDKGLIVPVIRDADRLNLAGIARVLDDLASRARSRRLNPEEVQGGTFSITNIGTYGNLFGTPIINQPQVAILGTGAIKRRPVVIDEAIAIRSMMYLSLTYDHRLIDGLYAGSFLQRMVSVLERYEYDQRR
jgi:2-oxoglutarate dehydrogenase E2 component (dihydrolipoamide succinyltransferase)